MMTIVNTVVFIFAVIGTIGLFAVPFFMWRLRVLSKMRQEMLTKLRRANPDATQEDVTAIYKTILAEKDREDRELMDWAEERWAERERRAIYSVMAMKD
jgi:hypothetical protein